MCWSKHLKAKSVNIPAGIPQFFSPLSYRIPANFVPIPVATPQYQPSSPRNVIPVPVQLSSRPSLYPRPVKGLLLGYPHY